MFKEYSIYILYFLKRIVDNGKDLSKFVLISHHGVEVNDHSNHDFYLYIYTYVLKFVQ